MGRLPIQPVWRDPNKAKERIYQMRLKRPNPPTPEAIKRAQFVDKTYKWTGK